MPIYEYECVGCGRRKENFQKDRDEHLIYCMGCQEMMRRVMSPSNFHLKGTCWAKDGYTMQHQDGSRVVSVGPPENE